VPPVRAAAAYGILVLHLRRFSPEDAHTLVSFTATGKIAGAS
jgi:hypothetical protein